MTPSDGWLTRFLLLRGLGAIYLVAFLSYVAQWRPLLGAEGLLPAARFLARAEARGVHLPTVFALDASDGALGVVGWLGVALSAGVLLGRANMLVLTTLWGLYLSIVNAGQLWYGYGWEILLLEAGFLAIWTVPVLDTRPFPALPTPTVVLWLYRWLVFRLMFGAGLIKIRGDACWRELTCLDAHFLTQPLPNPLSPVFHALPAWVHAGMVGWNHVVELGVPFFCLGTRRMRLFAGLVIVHFQLTLLLSGNLSFFNWLTIVLCVPLFDDAALARVLRPWRHRVGAAGETPPARRGLAIGVALLVGTLSVEPTLNLLSPAQAMNRSFGAWHLVNTYGAFGTVGQERPEIVLEGSDDGVTWRPYELPCKPGALGRRPCWIAPFQPRLDWQFWFAAQQSPSRSLWLVHLMDLILRGHPAGTALLADNPFPDAPPHVLRAALYRYDYAPAGSPDWWTREALGVWVRPLTVDDPLLVELRAQEGW